MTSPDRTNKFLFSYKEQPLSHLYIKHSFNLLVKVFLSVLLKCLSYKKNEAPLVGAQSGSRIYQSQKIKIHCGGGGGGLVMANFQKSISIFLTSLLGWNLHFRGGGGGGMGEGAVGDDQFSKVNFKFFKSSPEGKFTFPGWGGGGWWWPISNFWCRVQIC